MRSNDIEKALRVILGASSASDGLVITLRRHDEYEALIERIHALERSNESLLNQVRNMSEYANLYLAALDDIRACRARLEVLGEDTSFIVSLKSR